MRWRKVLVNGLSSATDDQGCTAGFANLAEMDGNREASHSGDVARDGLDEDGGEEDGEAASAANELEECLVG